MRQLAQVRTVVEQQLNECSAIHDITVEEVGNDLQVYYHIGNGAQSGFEVRDQYKRGMSTSSKFEVVNARITLPAPDDFDDAAPYESADAYAQRVYDSVGSGLVSPPSSAAAPKMNGERMVTIPHNNHGGDIQDYLQWVVNVAEDVAT